MTRLGRLLVLLLIAAGTARAQGGEGREPDDAFVLPSRRTLRPLPPGASRAEAVDTSTGRVAALSLQEALIGALQRNLEIEVESYTPLLREADIATARSRFDPLGYWSISRQRSIQQGSSSLAGASTVEQVLDQMRTGLRKTGIGGTTYDLSIGGRRSSSNNSFSTSPVQYTTDMTLTVTQPLLRNLGFDVQRADLDLARAAHDRSLHAFQATAHDIVNRTERAYWDLVFARENLQIQEDSLRLAEEALQISRIQHDLGTVGKIDVLDSESRVADARLALIQARTQRADAEDSLKGLFDPENASLLWAVSVVPTEQLPIDSPRVSGGHIDVLESINHALAYRPDILQQRLQVGSQGIEVQRAKNLLLPKLDVEGSFTMNGLEGSFENSIDTTTTGRFFTWQVGLALEIPFGNRAAMARYESALIGYRQAEARVRQIERAAVLEVRSAARAVESKIEEINAAKRSKFFAREKWEAERSRYRAGERTAFEVNEFRNDYIRARSVEVRAFTEYFKALSDLKRSESSALEDLRRQGYRIRPGR